MRIYDSQGNIRPQVPVDTNVGIQFQDEGVNLGTPSTVNVVNFVGSAVTAARVGDTVTATITGGGGSPGGPTTSVQVNNGGVLLGSADFTWDDTTKSLGLANGVNPVTVDTAAGITIVAASSGTTYGLEQFHIHLESNTQGFVGYRVSNYSSGLGAKAGFIGYTVDGTTVEMYVSNNLGVVAYLVGGPTSAQTVLNAGYRLVYGVDDIAVGLVDVDRNTVLKLASNAAADVDGFVYLPLVVGVQTGVPAKLTGEYANTAPVRVQDNAGTVTLQAYVNSAWNTIGGSGGGLTYRQILSAVSYGG
jgi:hypothetical protein